MLNISLFYLQDNAIGKTENGDPTHDMAIPLHGLLLAKDFIGEEPRNLSRNSFRAASGHTPPTSSPDEVKREVSRTTSGSSRRGPTPTGSDLTLGDFVVNHDLRRGKSKMVYHVPVVLVKLFRGNSGN